MTREETTQVIRIISAAYPNWKVDGDNVRDVIDLWATVFESVPADAVRSALSVYVAQPHDYAPSPGKIMEILRSAQPEPTEAEYWTLVAKAIRNGIYGAEEEFNKLPVVVQKAIGSPDYLRNLATMEDPNWSVESSNFYKRLATVQERVRNEALIPEKIKDMLRLEEK